MTLGCIGRSSSLLLGASLAPQPGHGSVLSTQYTLYFTLSPILNRPEVKTVAFFEQFIAFAVFGAVLFAVYPRRLNFVCLVTLSSAVCLEVLQTLTRDRHGTLVDALQK